MWKAIHKTLIASLLTTIKTRQSIWLPFKLIFKFCKSNNATKTFLSASFLQNACRANIWIYWWIPRSIAMQLIVCRSSWPVTTHPTHWMKKFYHWKMLATNKTLTINFEFEIACKYEKWNWFRIALLGKLNSSYCFLKLEYIYINFEQIVLNRKPETTQPKWLTAIFSKNNVFQYVGFHHMCGSRNHR